MGTETIGPAKPVAVSTGLVGPGIKRKQSAAHGGNTTTSQNPTRKTPQETGSHAMTANDPDHAGVGGRVAEVNGVGVARAPLWNVQEPEGAARIARDGSGCGPADRRIRRVT